MERKEEMKEHDERMYQGGKGMVLSVVKHRRTLKRKCISDSRMNETGTRISERERERAKRMESEETEGRKRGGKTNSRINLFRSVEVKEGIQR